MPTSHNYAISQIYAACLLSLAPSVHLDGNTSETAALSLSLSFSLSFFPFLAQSSKSLAFFSFFFLVVVVSSLWLVLNVDAGDELLGYAADVSLSAVSCLHSHLEVEGFFCFVFLPATLPPSTVPLSFFPSAEVSCLREKKKKEEEAKASVPAGHKAVGTTLSL